MVILGYNVRELARKTWSEVWKDNLLGMSAEAAYNLFFSIFPLLLFIAPLLSLVGDKEALIRSMLVRVEPFIPETALTVIEAVLRDAVFTETAPALMSVGALLAAYTGSNMIATLASALNRAYDIEDPRPFLKRRLMAIAIVVAVGVALPLSTTLLLVGRNVADFVVGATGLGPEAAILWQALRYPVAFLLIVGVLWLIYYFLPATEQRKRQVLAGATVAAVLWIGVTLLFRWYVTTVAVYGRTYGVIGGVIVLLTWIYLSMFVVLVGGELNAELARGTGALRQREPVLYGGRITTGDQIDDPSTKID